MAEAGGMFSSAEHSSFGPGPVPRGKINSGERLFSVGQHVLGVCAHRVCGGGVCLCAPGQFQVIRVVAPYWVFGEWAHV